MLQEFLILRILRPIAFIMSRISDKNRERIFVLSGLMAFGLYFLNMSQKISMPYLLYFAMGCFFMGIMIVAFLKEDIKAVKFDKRLIVCWNAVGIFMLIASLRFEIDWISEALIFLVACPIAYIVWGNIEHKYFMNLVSRVCEYSFVIYFVIVCLFFPVSTKQYSGLFLNVNTAAQYLVLVFACFLVKLLEEKKGIGRIFEYVLFGFCSALILYSNSRTGQLAQIMVVLFVVVTFLFSNRDKLKEKIIRILLPIVFVMIFAIPTTVHVLNGGNICWKSVNSLLSSKEALPQQSTQDSSQGQSVEEPNIEQSQSAESFLEYNRQRVDNVGKNLDAISTGRISIWKAYLDKVELFGSGEEEKFWIESRQTYYTTAHMTPLTVAFRFGAVCAVIYLVYLMLAGIKSIQYGIRSKEACGLLPLAITIAFGVTCMLESINTPFSYMITIYYYYIQTVLITESEKVE